MRLIRNLSKNDALRELQRVGADPHGIASMLPKMEHCVIVVEGLRCKVANIMKQEMLSLGGDVAVARDSVACTVELTDALVTGTRKQVDRFIEKLASQPFGLRDISRDMQLLLERSERTDFVLTTPRRTISLGDRTLVMGIINMTPDSFSDGGKYGSVDEAVEAALRMEEEGADLIDVGGESTRPGAGSLPVADELNRVIPLVRALASRSGIPVSVDTTKKAVAEAAVGEGAELINDISALRFDPGMAPFAASAGVPVILMHMRGTPETMQRGDLEYESLQGELINFFEVRKEAAMQAGIDEENIVFDPGIGFGKTGADNCTLIRTLDDFKCLGRPLLVGPSRKSFIGNITGGAPEERLEGTAAAVTAAVLAGAHIVRVHDVGFMRRVVDMADAIAGPARNHP
ncbi:MAG: hypothetical protein AVO39_08495 [delta proteobacterium MLS_D]|jgi:dihydropteroate synthase|nr:MAG: hypothetical protein AVO39_08495 [delta proteobacterium MLS_D]